MQTPESAYLPPAGDVCGRLHTRDVHNPSHREAEET